MSTTRYYNKNNKYSAFSLIELSIVLIIMGLLVAGITGGASLIETARINSLKREIDEHIRDIFIFYGRVGRLPGDLDNSGKIGYQSGRVAYATGSFSEPYNTVSVGAIASPFVELYLYGISPFKPDPSGSGINSDNPYNMASTTRPFSKIYKEFSFFHRYAAEYGNSGYFLYKNGDRTSLDILIPEDLKNTVNIIRKIEGKFDDGNHNTGNIRAFCKNSSGGNGGSETYATAAVCAEVLFVFDLK
jgi:prepilin-type N-terminal cleavage/methylation domain-containing protein